MAEHEEKIPLSPPLVREKAMQRWFLGSNSMPCVSLDFEYPSWIFIVAYLWRETGRSLTG